MFPGAVELLAGLRSLGLRSVIVSNVQVRGALEYWRDFSDLHVAHPVDAVVTSLDVGFRKPHPDSFEAAFREAGRAPAECVMIGHAEPNVRPKAAAKRDIEPAVALGMRALRVAVSAPGR